MFNYARTNEQGRQLETVGAQAIAKGAIAPVRPLMRRPWQVPGLTIRQARTLANLRPPTRHGDKFTTPMQDPANDTTAQRFQLTVNARAMKAWVKPAFQPHHTYELARFIVPIGGVGVVRSILQYSEADPAAVPIPEPHALLTGSPWEISAIQRVGGDMRWHLRLQQIRDVDLPDAFEELPLATLLPGYGHPDLPFLDFQYFNFAMPDAGVFLLVPGGFVLRMYVEIGADERPFLAIGGMLRGYTQPAHNRDALFNMRHGWQW